MYLTFVNSSVSFGTCDDKSEDKVFKDLYVTPNSISEDIQLVDGSLLHPFPDLQDAITKGEEICAQVWSCNITIYLMKGDHYLLRGRDYYKPMY